MKKRRLTRRKSVAVGRGSATPSKETEAEAHGDAVVPAGSKKKPAGFCRTTTQLTEQDTRSLCGAIFDAVTMSTEKDVVKSMRAQTRLHNEEVQAAGKGHTLGPPQIWARGGLIAGLQKHGTAVGAANAATLTTGCSKQLDGMSMNTNEVLLHGRSDVPIRASSHHSGGRQVRRTRPSRERAAGSSTQVRQSTADLAVSRTPTVAGHPTR